MDADIELVAHRADRITMQVIGGLVVVLTLALTVQSFIAAGVYLWASPVTVGLLADTSTPTSGPVSAATFDTVYVTTEALSMGARVCFAVGSVLLGLTALAVGGALAWLMFGASSGRPFRAGLYRFTLAAAFALFLGPLLSTAISGFGSMQAAVELDAYVPDVLIPGWSVSSWGFAIPLIGLALMVLAYVFRYMQRLERDTKGLV